MKSFAVLIFLLAGILSWSALDAQSNQSIEEDLKSIRVWYVQTEGKLGQCEINKTSDWTDDDNYSGYSPEITGYYDDAQNLYIKLVEAGIAEWMEETKAYYLNENGLFFYHSKGYYAEELYSAEELGTTEEKLIDAGAEPKSLRAFEHRIYFSDGQIIKYLTKSKVIPTDQSDFDLSNMGNHKGNIEELQAQEFIDHAEKIIQALD